MPNDPNLLRRSRAEDQDPSTERRRRRSQDPLVALHYQLSETRRQGALDTVVVADGSGVVVAGAGSWAACEELAAFAPLILEGTLRGFERVTVRTVDVGGDRVLLCARSNGEGDAPDEREHAMRHAALGISRILQAA
jgi:hypothetical protein